MTSATVILASAGDEPVYRWTTRGTGATASGSAADVAAAFADADALTVLLGTAHVLLTEVTVKVRNRRVLDSAVAYALEDQLAQDVDELRFEIGPATGADTYPVAVAARSLIDAIDEAFTATGFDTVRCVPYVMALPLEPQRHTVLDDGVLTVVRSGAYRGFTAPPGTAGALLERSERETGETLARTRFTLGNSDPVSDGEAPARSVAPANFGDWLDTNLGAAPNFGFTVERAGRAPAFERKLAVAGALLLVALVVHTGFVYSRTSDNEQRITVAETATQTAFKEAFPDVKRVVNPKVQAARELAALRDARPRGLAFLDGIHALGSAVSALGGDTILKSVRYLGGRFDLTLETPDLAALEQVRAALIADDLSAEIISAENRDERVVGRLQFERSSQ